MMQSTDLRDRNHSAAGRRLDFTFDRRVAVEGQMSPRQVIVLEVRSQDAPQVSFVYHEDMIEALSPDRTNQAFAIRTLPGRPRRRHDFFDVHMLDSTSEELAVDGVAVADQESRGMILGKRFDDLLRCPFRRRMSGDAEVNNMAPIVTKNYEGEKYSKCCGGDGKEVDRDDISNMVV